MIWTEQGISQRSGDYKLSFRPPLLLRLLNDHQIALKSPVISRSLWYLCSRNHICSDLISMVFISSKNGRVTFRVTVPDTITTWVLQAIAVSNTTGFGLTPSFNLRAFKPFFISIKLPYSAQRFEQVSVIATVFNYKETSEMVIFASF